MLLHSAAPRGWVTGWYGPPFLVSSVCQSGRMTSPKCFPAKRKKAQYAQWWGYCAWKNSYGSVEAAAWGIRRGILKTSVDTVYSILIQLSILYLYLRFPRKQHLNAYEKLNSVFIFENSLVHQCILVYQEGEKNFYYNYARI